MKLLLNLVYKNLKSNKVITIALAAFLMISTVFMAGGLRVVGTMLSSLNGLNEVAVMTDYLQMHKGTYDEAAFNRFVDEHDYIDDSLIVEMLNIRNAGILYQGQTFERYLMDNGFVTQNEAFDYLLNMDNEVAEVEDGEIGVPVYYAEELGIQVGDVITLIEGDYRNELMVSTIIRDSSMNPAITSSKRFLISQRELNDISQEMGDWEYLFEFRLEEDSSVAALGKDYMEAKLPSNGVALSKSALIMLNTLSYGVIAFIIITISIILIMIALLCLSFIIRATLAEENYTIGEMKAIGFPGRSILTMFLSKYLILIMITGLLGYLIAIPFGDYFSASVVLYCGEGTSSWMKWIIPLLGTILLSLIIVMRCRSIIRKNLKSTVVELMRGEDGVKKEGHYRLPTGGFKNQNVSIAFGELRCKWKEYIVIFCIFVVSSFLILLPMNMKHTVENPSFMSYMGVGESDVRIDIQYSENLSKQRDAAHRYLESDSEIKKYAIYQNAYVQIQNTSGDWEYLRVENGDESVFPIEYLEGSAPIEGSEIALSYLIASESEKVVGDSLLLSYQGNEQSFLISGIYQDITYGGKTAKAAIDFDEEDIEVYIIYLDVDDAVILADKTDQLRSILIDSKITPINEFVAQTLGGITNDIKLVERAAIAISLLLILLITVMFIQLITAREHNTIAIKKAIGFTNRDIRIQFGIRIFIIQFLAIIIGTILSNLLGEAIFSLILSSMGASKIIMLVDPVKSYLLSPLLQLVLVFATVIMSTKVVTKYHIRDHIME